MCSECEKRDKIIQGIEDELQQLSHAFFMVETMMRSDSMKDKILLRKSFEDNHTAWMCGPPDDYRRWKEEQNLLSKADIEAMEITQL